MSGYDSDDPVANFISEYFESIENGTASPSLDTLTPPEREEAQQLLSDLDVDFDVDVEIPPIEESKFALQQGIVRDPPAVAVRGGAVRSARTSAGLTEADVAMRMTELGYTTDAARIAEIEDADSTMMAGRDARRLAAVVSVPLEAIEASAEPWPAEDRGALDDIRDDHELLEMGRHLVFRVGEGFYAGVIRCRGLARDLDSLTFRRVAGALLQGEWNYLHAAVLLTATTPRKVLVLDPFDCVPRLAAPSGEMGFGALEPADDLANALSHYEMRFDLKWSDPPSYFSTRQAPALSNTLDVAHFQAAIDVVFKNVNRLGEPKRAAYRATIEFVRAMQPDVVKDLVTSAAEADGDELADLMLQAVGT